METTILKYRGIHEKVQEMSSQVFDTPYTLSIHPSTHKQLKRHLQNTFHEFPFSSSVHHVFIFTESVQAL